MHGDWNANLAFAQRWLIARGCPADAIEPAPDLPWTRSSDPESRELRYHLRDSGTRYRIEGTYTHESPPNSHTWTVAEDMLAGPTDAPVHVFLEDFGIDDGSYRIRDHTFPDLDAAADWLHARFTLPPRCHHRIPAAAAQQTIPATAPGRRR